MTKSPRFDPDHLREEICSLPARPGVYLFRGAGGEVLYVGKAKSLRDRGRSYLGGEAEKSLMLRELGRRIRGLETFVLESEAEALLLEWNLIRAHRPRFNIQLRDDKSYPYIKVTTGEPFPRIFVTRRLEEDGSRYFGPFTDVGAMRQALRTIKRAYFVRSCHYRMPGELPDRPCLDYHIGRCKAPCAGYQSQEAYREMIDEILEVLSGRTEAVRQDAQRRMRSAVERLDFERAAELREVLRGLEALERRQSAVDFRGGDRDVLGVSQDREVACGVLLRVREGRLLGRQVRYLRNLGEAGRAEVVGALVKGFYLRRDDLPPELLAPEDFEDRPLIEEYLAARRDGPFRIAFPKRGHRRRLLALAEENAAHVLAQDRLRAEALAGETGSEGGRTVEDDVPPTARRLAELLELPEPIRSLICFDVSTLAGSESVGSAAWLEDGRPRKEEYRRFRIRAAEIGRPDDYGAMQEIVGRYFERRVREGRTLPDLVVIDGGRGQLSAALQAMEGAGVSDLLAVGLAKREEEVFRPAGGRPLRLERTDPALHWLQRARDEAHRFALAYHRSLRRRRTLRSRLREVRGVGPAREQELLRRFGSLDAVRAASLDELCRTPGIGRATAERIRHTLRGGTAADARTRGASDLATLAHAGTEPVPEDG